MKITKIETFANTRVCFVRVRTEDGNEGWGQTAPTNGDITATVLHRQVAQHVLGMDALSHSLEAFCSPLHHPMAHGIALEGMRLVQQWLPRAFADGSDLEETERGAHSLKSSAANIGAELLRTLVTRMESAALEGNPDEARSLLPEIEAAYAGAMQELQNIEREMKE